MARTKISEFSATAADNTDIDSIDIAEGCAPSGINNAIRELMAQLKDFQTGAAGDSFNGNVNATTVDTTNLEVSNLKAKDGTAAGSIADSTGVVTLTSVTGTTADYTNLEVTNLKAKDGTAAGSIADSTGVVTLASAVLTTADINGGTVDGVVIGGATPAAATFTTLATSDGAISPQTGFRNRIINGGMTIDQRNAGAAVTGTTAYAVDRFAVRIAGGGSGVITAQRSTTIPSGQGFINSLLLQATTTDTSIGATEAYWLQQKIEGFNTSDFGYGASGAATVTLSFWVRSSITGTFSTVLQNSAGNRSYVSEYTISAADTWEKKTITVAGDTGGTWLTDNGVGVSVFFCLAVGSTYQQAAGSWGTTAFATGSPNQVNFMNTLNSTFYITGVQLEKGSTATPFEFRSIGTELALCQRYLPAFMSAGVIGAGGTVRTATIAAVSVPFPVQTRVAPTGITTNTSTGVNYAAIAAGGGDFTNMAITFSSASNMNSNLLFTNGAATMTVGHGIQASLNSVGYVYFNGCEL